MFERSWGTDSLSRVVRRSSGTPGPTEATTRRPGYLLPGDQPRAPADEGETSLDPVELEGAGFESQRQGGDLPSAMRRVAPLLRAESHHCGRSGVVTVACGVGIGELLVNCPERGAGDATYELERGRVVDGAIVLTGENARCIRRNARVLRGWVSEGGSLVDRPIRHW